MTPMLFMQDRQPILSPMVWAGYEVLDPALPGPLAAITSFLEFYRSTAANGELFSYFIFFISISVSSKTLASLYY